MSMIVDGVLVCAVVSVILGNGARIFSVIVGGLEIPDGRELRFLSDTAAPLPQPRPHLTFNGWAAEIVRYACAL